MDKYEILNSFAVILLLFTALIDWNLYSWFILVGVIFILIACYLRKNEVKNLK